MAGGERRGRGAGEVRARSRLLERRIERDAQPGPRRERGAGGVQHRGLQRRRWWAVGGVEVAVLAAAVAKRRCWGQRRCLRERAARLVRALDRQVGALVQCAARPRAARDPRCPRRQELEVAAVRFVDDQRHPRRLTDATGGQAGSALAGWEAGAAGAARW